MTGSVDTCIGTITAAPPATVAGPPDTHFYGLQAWSIAGTGKIVRVASVVIQRPDMTIPHFPLAVGDPVVVTIVGNKTVYSSWVSKPDWFDCGA